MGVPLFNSTHNVHHLFPDQIAKHRQCFQFYSSVYRHMLFCGPGDRAEDRRELSKKQMQTTTTIILTVTMKTRNVLKMYVTLV
jgi:hypothetical protein